jgi:hypothetical protein
LTAAPNRETVAVRTCAQTRCATETALVLVVDAERVWPPPPPHPATTTQHSESAKQAGRLTRVFELTV